MSEWQPIETAPVGENILVWMPAKDGDGNEYPVWPAIITQDEGEEPWVDVPSWAADVVSYSLGDKNPTHWMPLPAPPNPVNVTGV